MNSPGRYEDPCAGRKEATVQGRPGPAVPVHLGMKGAAARNHLRAAAAGSVPVGRFNKTSGYGWTKDLARTKHRKGTIYPGRFVSHGTGGPRRARPERAPDGEAGLILPVTHEV